MIDQDVVDRLSYLEKKVLLALRDLRSASPDEILRAAELNQLVEVMNAASWLQAKRLVDIDEKVTREYSLRNQEAALRELPEKAVVREILSKYDGRATTRQLKSDGKFSPADLQIALGWIRKKGWGELSKEGEETVVTLTRDGHEALEITCVNLII